MTHWHFIGIGGAGMSVLAHALLDRGDTVSGSDQSDSVALEGLRARGATVSVGHRADNPGLAAADQVVITAAVPADNPELRAARTAGKPVVKRAVVLGALMDERVGVAVAGTHGKTTTTAMVAWILREAGRDPAFLVGGVMSDLGTGGHWGGGAELVAEADEYDASFWQLRPQVGVITNIEADHLDYYPDLAAIHDAFRRFAANVRPGGTLLICGDAPGARRLYDDLQAQPAAEGTPVRYLLYGTGADCTWRAANERLNDNGGTDFVVVLEGRHLTTVSLLLPGRHNVLNALAALAAVAALGVTPLDAAAALGRFHGTWRRFQVKGTVDGVLVVDDYAHHPTEIAANERLNDNGGTDFVVVLEGRHLTTASLLLPGRHNVLNALAALAAVAALGVTPLDAAAALGRFHGTWRRFQVKGTVDGVLVVDDYAHHPTEIAANIAAARRHLPGRRLVVVFQPHTYSRTRSFLAEFAEALQAADIVIVCEIYAARERDTLGMSGRLLAERIEALAPGKAHFAPDLAAAADLAAVLLRPGDVLITFGAGDVWKVGEMLLSGNAATSMES